MMYKFQLIISIVAVILCVHAIKLCVENKNGQNSDSCLMENESLCCKSLEYLIQNSQLLTENVTVAIMEDCVLNEVVSIRGLEDFQLESKLGTKIKCSASAINAGLYFENITNLKLVNLTIEGCAMTQNSSVSEINTTEFDENTHVKLKIQCAVYIIDCNDLILLNLNFSHNKGTGLVIYDTNGSVVLDNCMFYGNMLPSDGENQSGGGGVLIEFTYCYLTQKPDEHCSKNISDSAYVIKDCKFINNSVSEINPTVSAYTDFGSGIYQGLGRGGGLCITLRGVSTLNTINVINCEFVNNTASTWGGGMYLSLRNKPSKNSIQVEESKFINNTCLQEGGGGVKISLITYNGSSSFNNITFKNTHFTSNKAERAGGVDLSTTREDNLHHIETQLKNNVIFQNCTWEKNTAKVASAMDISPALWDVLGNGVLLIPKFIDCTFHANYLYKNIIPLSENVEQRNTGAGTLLISSYAVDFDGFNRFSNNKGSAIYLQSGIVSLLEGGQLSFIGNSAKRGGAIAFYAFSVMYFNSNTNVLFQNNRARLRGGAIYAFSIDQHEVFSSRSCFLQVISRRLMPTERNASITFENNTSDLIIGNSIFATSLDPCKNNCHLRSNFTAHELFECIGTIKGLKSGDITTNARRYEVTMNRSILDNLVPGKYFSIPIAAYDELNQSVNTAYDIALKTNNSVELEQKSTPYVTNTTITLLGDGVKEINNTLILERETSTLYLNVTIKECPPGHTIDSSGKCRCDPWKFRGIWSCNRKNRVAFLLNGFWIGLCGSEQCAGQCPPGFCTDRASTNLTMSIHETDKLVCAQNRRGKLCGNCVAGHSVYYHSPSYKCGNESLCNYGMLLYFASEIVPLTALFIAIILLNINFTKGSLNGLILYAQIIDSLALHSYKIVNSSGVIDTLTEAYRFIYTMSNLNFFKLEVLSFCLWKGATTLDILAWSYFTISYVLFLIIATIFLLNTTKCKKLCTCWRPHSLKNAVIHGFTGFLIMSYSLCAKVSFQILKTTKLTGYNLEKPETVVQVSGENHNFDSFHIRYGLTAVVFLLLIVILPPLLLILYPLSFKILALCRLSELRVVTRVSNIIPLQLFDSFQSCFKDNLRFFSGLYFIYRVTPLLISVLAPDKAVFYMSVEVFLITALTLNAVLQPYKQFRHNVLDSLIFANLAVINAISLFNYQRINEGKSNLDRTQRDLTTSIVFQLFFIYLPLFLIVGYGIWSLTKWIRAKKEERKILKLDYSQELLDSTYLPPLRDENAVTSIISSGPYYNHQQMETKMSY